MTIEDSSLKKLKLGLQQLANKEYKSVHKQAISMIQMDVDDAVPYCLLATIAADHGNHVKSLELFERAAELAPQNVYYQAYLGQALTLLGDQERAKLVADTAASLVIDDPYISDTIGVVYSRAGFHELAIPLFKKAVSMNEKPANFHYNLAASQQFLGDFAAAEQGYLETIARDPDAYRAWSSLVGLSRQTKQTNYLTQLTSLFESFANDEDASLHLGHAIAKTLEDFEQYEESLEWLHKAKRLKLLKAQAGAFSYDSLFDAAMSTVNNMPTLAQSRDQQSPIFIIGLPRTGTTLVDRIVSTHSDVNSAGELNVFPGLIKRATKTMSNMVMDVETLLKSTDLASSDLRLIGDAYIESLNQHSRGAQRVTDKMPLNFFYAGLIHKAIPNARIIALRRDPMDSCLSNYRQLLTVQHSYYQYTYDLKDTAKFYRRFDELMTHWRAQLPASRFMEIAYEDIVHDQESQTRRLLQFCNLDWQDACLRFHENEAPVSTASSVQVRQPLYSGSIGRWRRYGDKLESLQSALADLT